MGGETTGGAGGAVAADAAARGAMGSLDGPGTLGDSVWAMDACADEAGRGVAPAREAGGRGVVLGRRATRSGDEGEVERATVGRVMTVG